MNDILFGWRALLRAPRRTAAGIFGILLATGLLSSVLFYVAASARDMTQRSIAAVPVDMRAQALNNSMNLSTTQAMLLHQKDVLAAEPLTMSYFSGSAFNNGGRQLSTSSGSILALNPSYLRTFPPIRLVQGTLGNGIVLSQDLGTNLGAKVGDTITLRLPGGAHAYRGLVTGIANMKRADPLFAPTDPALAGLPFNPPVNVVIMPLAIFERDLQARLLHAPPPPSRLSAATTGTVVQSTALAVDREIHLRINRAALASDPSQAQIQTMRLRLSLEKLFPGELRVTDNLAATIDSVKQDILWAQILFVFLTLPGVLLAGYLSLYAAQALVQEQRREFALLRVRGATTPQILKIVGTTSGLTGLTATVLGLAAGILTVSLLTGTHLFTLANWRLWIGPLGWTAIAGLLLTIFATFLPVRGMLRREVVEERRLGEKQKRPVWERLYLDVVALVGAFVAYRITVANGFHPILNAEGNPTLSLSLSAFLGPLLFWIGAALLLFRTSSYLLTRYARGVGWFLRRVFGEIGTFASATAARQARAMARPAIVVALALSFGLSLSIFASTYDHQQAVDAQLTLGSDVKVTPRAGHREGVQLANRLSSVSQVAAVTPFKTTVAYVGTEIQDIFGVDAAGLGKASTLSDSFFLPHSASVTMRTLNATPDGILISQEMSRDYSIVVGDHVRLRLYNQRSRSYQVARFKVVGVVLEFATAPKDAFLVVNLRALTAATGDPSVNTFLVKTSGDPAGVAREIRRRLPFTQTESIASVQATLGSSLTALNLSALTRIEYVYTAIIASAGLLVFLLSMVRRRRQEFAIMRALGTTARQMGAFVISEAGIVGIGGLLVGIIVGAIQSVMLVTILTSIFDPPPDHALPSLPPLALLLGLSALGMILAASVSLWNVSRTRVSDALRQA